LTEGFITLSRGIREHWIYQKPEYYRAWSDILFSVNFKDNKSIIEGEIVVCKRGQSTLSIDSWAVVFGKGWTRQKVRTFFKLLSSDEMINTKGLRKTTILTVCNYNTYQLGQPRDNQEITNKQPRDNQEITTIEEGNKEKKEKKTQQGRENSFKDLIRTANDNRKEKCKPSTLNEFYEYWSTIGDNEKRMRFEKTKSFNTARRLTTWVNNNYNGTEKQQDKPLKIISNTETTVERMHRLSKESNN